MTIDPSTELDPYEHRGQHPDVCAICHPADELVPTWGEVVDGWEPDADGQGNEGLAAALDRIEEERTTSRATFGRDFTGTPDEGVLLRTLGPNGEPVFQVTFGYRNYAEALADADARRAARAEGDRSWWLPFDAKGAASHLASCGLVVPPTLAELAAAASR